MEFTFEEKLHLPDKPIDDIFQQQSDKSIVCLLAATASGKTSAIYRTLSKQFGLFFCCDANRSVVDSNQTTKDLLMSTFHRYLSDYSAQEILAFGVNLGLLVFISRIFSLLMFIKNKNTEIKQVEFLKLQTNDSTELSSLIFQALVEARYHHIKESSLIFLLNNIFKDLLTKLNIGQLPIFIDEAQTFCPNSTKLLGDKYTCTQFSTPRPNDLLSLVLTAFSAESVRNNSRLIITGTAFSAEVLQQVNSNAGKQDYDYVLVIVGQSLINTKDDLRDKLKSIMKITTELEKFIDESIDNYLPMRRRVFTLACANILKQNVNKREAFISAFESSLNTCQKKIAKYYKDLIDADNSKEILQLLKFLSFFNFTTLDHTFLVKLHPSLVNFKSSLISSGIAPYFTYPHSRKLFDKNKNISLEQQLNVCFLFNEPLCKRITKNIFSDVKIDNDVNIDKDSFWQSYFTGLVPKENEKHERLDVAFSIILAYLSKKKTGNRQSSIHSSE